MVWARLSKIMLNESKSMQIEFIILRIKVVARTMCTYNCPKNWKLVLSVEQS